MSQTVLRRPSSLEDRSRITISGRHHSLDTAYANDWARFQSWCASNHCAPIGASPELVARFLDDERSRGYSASTLNHRRAAIGHMHRRVCALPPLRQRNDEVIRSALAKAATPRTAQTLHQATTTVLRSILQTITESSLEADRDRGLLALRITGAFQLSELAALSFEDVAFQPGRLQILLGQGGRAGPRAALTIMDDTLIQPVELLERWVRRAHLASGRIFRHVAGNRASFALNKQDVGEIIERRATAAGYAGEALARITARKSSLSAPA